MHPLGCKLSAGTVAVTPEGAGSRVVWDAELEFADPAQEEQLAPMLREGYGAAMQQLKTVVEADS